MRVLLFISALFALISNISVDAANWVVIVAGSNGYDNYRHQSDTCHAYQVAKNFGVPENHIILMAYDDIAKNQYNPYPGQIFNKPTTKGTVGQDVYKGCKISYSGNTVTAANFLAVIQGDATKVPAGHPVVNSTANDNIFIYYSDHGAVGIVAMPVGDYLYAEDLNTALQSMYKAKKYAKLVFYLEACEAGSMFEGILPTNINVYTTTASNAEESSYGTYCAPDDMVNGKEIDSCLGDEYSVNWMENSDAVGQLETIADQSSIVIKATVNSHVMEYGTKAFTNLPIGAFQGNLNNSTISMEDLPQLFAKRGHLNVESSSSGVVDSRDISLHLAYYRYLRAVQSKSSTLSIQQANDELEAEIATRSYADLFFQRFSSSIKSDGSLLGQSKLPVSGTACQKAVDSALFQCGIYNDYSMKYHNVVVNACMQPHVCDTQTLVNAVNNLCNELPKPVNYKF